jgi:murein DD-endopeptidase MepM/ murein hydrolase activator NlpD
MLVNNKFKLLTIIVLIFSVIFTTGFSKISTTPKTVYRVYLKGESLGLIKSKKALEDYIDKKQEEIKKKYNVDKVYVPEELDIVKEITYENNIKTTKEIYEEIKDISPFTINGYSIKIKGLDTKDSSGKTVKGSTQVIYVLDRNIFENSIVKAVKSFISEDDYNNYSNGTQKEIETTGKIIEDIYLKNKITIKKSKIPVNKTIYESEDDLSKYLLFGTTEAQATYTIQDGDTISDIAYNNKMSTQEFLIANPSLQDENSLLSPGQVVTLGVLKPQFSVVEEDKVVKDVESNYTTETVEDSSKCSYVSETTQAGVKGLDRVTQKVQIINGETVNTVNVSTETIKESIKEIITKGTKSCGGSGAWSTSGPRPSNGYFGWPATCSSVSSPYGWRWGVLHDGTDIAGCGYGSNIYAAAEGEVVQSGYKYDNGQFITIRHPNGYYTMYAHLCNGCRYVSVGDYVQKGQVIGGMGRTGAATGVHLHFSIWTGYPYRGGTALNAMSFY